ncbi:MAG: hypothetical protein ACRDIU_09555 [Actinomycetota bacterium]
MTAPTGAETTTTFSSSAFENGQSGARPNGNASNQRKMSRAEAGRKGGLSTKQRYGENYFSDIGRMGGKKGGESTKKKYGVEFYQQIGRKGGAR